MIDQDHHDWLDEHLAVKGYIPDDGFTGRVVSQLRQSPPLAVGNLRKRILVISASFSAGVATGLAIMQVGPIREAIKHLASRDAVVEGMNHLAPLLQQPTVLYGAAGGIVALGFAAIPFLRRWA